MTACNRVRAWRKLEKLLFQSPRLPNIGRIQREKWIRDRQRDEDKLGIPGEDPNTHSNMFTGGTGVWCCRGAFLSPRQLKKTPISCGAELAFIPHRRSIHLLSDDHSYVYYHSSRNACMDSCIRYLLHQRGHSRDVTWTLQKLACTGFRNYFLPFFLYCLHPVSLLIKSKSGIH